MFVVFFDICYSYYCDKLASYGISYPLETAIRDFRYAAIDFARVILAYLYSLLSFYLIIFDSLKLFFQILHTTIFGCCY